MAEVHTTHTVLSVTGCVRFSKFIFGGGLKILLHPQLHSVTVQNKELCDMVHIHMMLFVATHTHRV